MHLVYGGRDRQAWHEAVVVSGWISAGPGAGGRCCNSGQEFSRNCLAGTESWVPALSLRDSGKSLRLQDISSPKCNKEEVDEELRRCCLRGCYRSSGGNCP